MKHFIKYKRINDWYSVSELQELLDSFIKKGEEIISYYENPEPQMVALSNEEYLNVIDKVPDDQKSEFPSTLCVTKYEVTIIVGKRQEIL